MRSSGYVASFDSASGMLIALSRYLKGKDFPSFAGLPRTLVSILGFMAGVIPHLPVKAQEAVYTYAGGLEAISVSRLAAVDSAQVRRWVVSQYPDRKYPAIAIGSSNGAAVHLWSLLGIPWLPQTLFIAVRRRMDPNDPKQELQWSIEPARRFLDRNTDLALHHMMDPVQDLLMASVLSYFRIKFLELGLYRNFIEQHLEPGGTILVTDCGLKWRVKQAGERHYFQFGALGGASMDEYYRGGPRVAASLKRQGLSASRWDAPEPDLEKPEAEWGFAAELMDDIRRLADEKGFRVRRLAFDRPEDLSLPVADFYQEHYRARSIPCDRLMIESFLLLEPYWALRAGVAPLWLVFPTEPYDRVAADFIKTRGGFNDIGLTLFCHGVDSIGVVPAERWKEVLRLGRRGFFVGVSPEVYPRDFRVFFRFQQEFRRRFPARYTLPEPVPLRDFEAFLRQRADSYNVQYLDESR